VLHLLGCDRGKVSLPRKVLLEQAVEVLVAAALPWRMRISEIDLRRQPFLDRAVVGEFAASITGDAQDMIAQAPQLRLDHSSHLLGRAACAPTHSGEACGAFHQRHNHAAAAAHAQAAIKAGINEVPVNVHNVTRAQADQLLLEAAEAAESHSR